MKQLELRRKVGSASLLWEETRKDPVLAAMFDDQIPQNTEIFIPEDTRSFTLEGVFDDYLNLDEVFCRLAALESFRFACCYWKSLDFQFLQPCRNLREIIVGGKWSDVDSNWVGEFPELRVLILGVSAHIRSDVLARCTRLVELNIPDPKSIGGMASLTPLKNLERLYVGEVCASNLTSLSGLARLRRLGIAARRLKSAEGVGRLTDLEWLNIQGGISEIPSEFGQLRALKELTLDWNPRIKNLEPLRGLPIEKLSLKGLKRLDSIAPISSLPDLVELWIGGPLGDGDVSPLLEHPKLKRCVVLGKKFYSQRLRDAARHTKCEFEIR